MMQESDQPGPDGKLVRKKFESYTSQEAEHGESIDEVLDRIGHLTSFIASKIGALNYARMLERMATIGAMSSGDSPMCCDVFVHDDCGPAKDQFVGYVYVGIKPIEEVITIPEVQAHIAEVNAYRAVDERKRGTPTEPGMN